MPPAAEVAALCSPPWAATMAQGCKDARTCWWGRSDAQEQGRATQLRTPNRHHPRDGFALLCADKAQIEQLSQGLDQELSGSTVLVPWLQHKASQRVQAVPAQRCLSCQCSSQPSVTAQVCGCAGAPRCRSSSLGFKGRRDNCEGPQQQGQGNDLTRGGGQRLFCAGSWPDCAEGQSGSETRGEAVLLWTWLPI